MRRLALVVLVASTGCAASAVLRASPTAALADNSATSARLKAYRTIMVLPPTGSERGAVTHLSFLEKELLRRGITVISSGVTGRVVLDVTPEGKKNEGAAQLTDLERALILARKSNADALVQVGVMEFAKRRGDRYFVIDRIPGPNDPPGVYHEVGYDEFQAAGARGWALYGDRFVFQGKLIDSTSGEVVAALDVSQSVLDCLPGEYKAELEINGTADAPIVTLKSVNYHLNDPRVLELARSKARDQVISRLAERIAGGEGAPVGATPATIQAVPGPASPPAAAPPPSAAPLPPPPPPPSAHAPEAAPAPAAAPIAAPAAGDTIRFYTAAGKIEGVLTDKLPNGYLVRTAKGMKVVPYEQIERMEKIR